MADTTTNNALAEMRRRYDLASDYVADLYDQARDDIKFVAVPGNQWDEALRKRRDRRPCYEFPKLAGHVRQVINEMRQSRPSGKVRGVEESDQGLAEIMQGLCRNIESSSDAETAYDIAFESAVQGGVGYWRIRTDYRDQDDFEQDIFIEPIRNPFAVKFDPASTKIDRSDAMFCFVEELIPKAEFERKYPDANVEDFDSDNDCVKWRDADQVRIAEYWWKEPVKRELWALSNGDVVFADDIEGGAETLAANGVEVVKTRVVEAHKVMCRLTNGHEWLTEAHEFPCKHIPIVPVWGNIQNIDGNDYWQGMVRPSKDQQRLHNVHRTAMTEAVAKAPKAPFLLKMRWIKGLEHFWNRANAEDYPYLPVADDADGMPQRAQQAELPTALIQLAAMDNDDIKAATGQYDASLGARSNETSGIAINSRKQQGATATFNYIDNLGKAIRYTYEILIDMIPRVYDTPRVVRILGEDGGAKWKQLYQTVTDPETGGPTVLNDISKGKYDVAVTIGPSYATQRMESAEVFSQMAASIGSAFPPLSAMLAYQVVKNVDAEGAEEVAKAMRKLLVAQGMLPPQEGEEPPQPPPPDPRVEAQVRKMLADAQKSEASAAKYAADAAKSGAEAQTVLPAAEADIGKTHAEIDKIIKETVAQQLQNMMQSGQLAPYINAPPNPHDGFSETAPPPQGGFFVPDSMG